MTPPRVTGVDTTAERDFWLGVERLGVAGVERAEAYLAAIDVLRAEVVRLYNQLSTNEADASRARIDDFYRLNPSVPRPDYSNFDEVNA